MSKIIDLTGQRFGRLLVIGRAENCLHSGRARWYCQCDCGELIVAAGLFLRRGQTSCGCHTYEMLTDRNKSMAGKAPTNRKSRKTAKSLVGKRFGKLTVVARNEKCLSRNVYWLCHCDCGNTAIVRGNELRIGKTRSCGCIKGKHGMGDTPEYTAWKNMIQRCGNPENKSYANYGGRGITVCERWHKFENFYADIGRRPTPKHSIDRINNDGSYEPGNCRWATSREQRINQRQRSSKRK